MRNEMGPKAKRERRTSAEKRDRKARFVLDRAQRTSLAVSIRLFHGDQGKKERGETDPNSPSSSDSRRWSGGMTQAKSEG